MLDLIRQRLSAGTASDLEVAEQQSVVNTQKAAIPPLEQTVPQNRNALALLIARPPEHVRVSGGSLRAHRYPRVTPGLPSELLAQRPDIREAEARLASANANVENARAQSSPASPDRRRRLPKRHPQAAVAAGVGFLYATAGLTQPIFDGGTLLGNLDLQKGIEDELLQNYRKAVISGFYRRGERA